MLDAKVFLKLLAAYFLLFLVSVTVTTDTAEAATYHWIQWNTYSFDGTTYKITGTINTGSDTVTVTYTNTQGLAGYQLSDGSGGSTDYYANGTDGPYGTSPYTSPTVENRPDNVTIIRLAYTGTNNLSFSKNVSNLALAFVSLNGTAFSFDRNFTVLSYGHPDVGKVQGYWGEGTATKTYGSGAYPYVVSGTGEPHGTLLFSGSFNSLSWTSGNENWHGFTVAIQGTSDEVASDTTAPTVTIDPADKTTSIAVNTNITITFNEEVRNLDDSSITDSSVGSLITLKNTNASGTDIPFTATIDSDKKVITIDPTSDFSADQIIYVSIGATVEDNYNNVIAATSVTMTTGSSLSGANSDKYTDPRAKKDVVGNIEAWSGIAERWARSNLGMIARRFDWLKRNKDNPDKTSYGACLKSDNQIINGLAGNFSRGESDFFMSNFVSLFQKYFLGARPAVSDAKSIVVDETLSQVNSLKQLAMEEMDISPVKISPLGGWSLWTEGDLAIGRIKGTDSGSGQDLSGYGVFIGIDRPIGENGFLGCSFGFGQSNTDVGSDGSGVKSDNYGVTGYTAFQLRTPQTVEAALGYGYIPMTIDRVDSGQSLNGSRDANQFFVSVALRNKPFYLWELPFAPYGRVEVAHTELDGFSENGGDLALSFDRQKLDTTTLFFGVDTDYTIKSGHMLFRPYGKFEYGINVNYRSDVNMRYVFDANSYCFELSRHDSSIWKTTLGFDLRINTSFCFSLIYSREQTDSLNYLDTFGVQTTISS
ncbi:MAG: autotransporter domain-containing protein [Candidatus Omnitrophica bacterium]|nr:autotransporter domain-containing protein [Candidatus Omnitrophota bacterium]